MAVPERRPLHLWVDADACPRAVKEILFRAAIRRALPLTLVANQALAAPASPHIRTVRVAAGFDAADRHIEAAVAPGDLVITADIPLAAAVVAKGALALDPRGRLYTAENIGECLAMRDLMTELRSSGTLRDGPAPLDSRDRQAFANQLDRLLARHAPA
jgi:uncharacterized protein YaiI (UPF0178 family)